MGRGRVGARVRVEAQLNDTTPTSVAVERYLFAVLTLTLMTPTWP